MNSLFDPADRSAILQRLEALQPGSARRWGKMDSAQMLAHCAIAMEAAMGGQPRKQILLGKLIGPFVRSSALGEKPFSKNSPTDPTFVMSDSREFIAERNRLLHLIQRFAEQGPSSVSGAVHTFFGKLTGEEWGVLIYKHLDHHLRQFEA